MIRVRPSNNLTLGDCLGGYMSRQKLPCWTPFIESDQIRCLFIDDFRLADNINELRAEFTITKSDDDFELDIKYPTSLGWTSITTIEFTLEVDDIYQSTTDLTNIRIRRIREGADGTMTGRINYPYNNPLGGTDVNFNDGSVTRYGCIFLDVEDATYLESITSYGIVEGATETNACQIDLMTDALNTQTIASTTTAPTGLTWTNTETISGNLAAGTYAIWFKTISSGAVGGITNVIRVNQGAGGDTEDLFVVGRHRRYDATMDFYTVYGAYDGTTIEGTEIDTFASLPGTVSLTPPPSGTRDYLLRVTEKNKYGVESQNLILDLAASIDDSGDDVTVPQTPTGLSLTFTNGGIANLEYDYVYTAGESVILSDVEIGTETDRGTPIFNVGTYASRTIDPVLWGTSVTARVRYIDNKGRTGEWATTTVTATFTPDTLPLRTNARVGGLASDSRLLDYYDIETDSDACLITEPGRTSLYYDGTLELYAQWDTDGALVLYLGDYALVNEAVSGAQSSYIEDAGSGIVYISDGTTRRVKVDTVNKTFSAVTFLQDITQCRRLTTPVTVDGVVYFQSFPTTINNMRAPEPWIALDGENVYLCTVSQT